MHNASVFADAKTIVTNMVEGEDEAGVISAPKYVMTLVSSDKLDSAALVADAIINTTDKIVNASTLYINGQKIACVKTAELNELIEASRTRFFIDGAENTAEFVDSVSTEQGFYLAGDVQEVESVRSTVLNLSVKTVSVTRTEVSVPYSTKKVRTASQLVGYSKVTTAGVNGVSIKTEAIENLNGQVVNKQVISTETVTAPVTQVITVGTASKRISSADRNRITSAGFIFPLPSGKYKVSSYYGDGRNHKGIDLCANKGTAIFAVASGTVIYSGYHKDYGYNVLVDHGNGLKTRYAHASALCVRKGDTVSQGDMIAAVGNTGYSTGNHLHFEVIVNGTRVNPAPYIGL